jgi:hypothetical protein
MNAEVIEGPNHSLAQALIGLENEPANAREADSDKSKVFPAVSSGQAEPDVVTRLQDFVPGRFQEQQKESPTR